jgi:hypothetical protein
MTKLNLPTQTLQKLRQLINPQNGSTYDFLGYTLNLDTGTLTDKLNSNWVRSLSEWHNQLWATLLTHYSVGNPAPLTGKLVKFKDIPGGYAYEGAFNKRAIQPVAEIFGEKPKELIEATKLLGGMQRTYADASSEIVVLKGIPLTYILWGTGEFAASASILYDESASSYLPTEDLAVLGELTTSRLIVAKKIVKC